MAFRILTNIRRTRRSTCACPACGCWLLFAYVRLLWYRCLASETLNKSWNIEGLLTFVNIYSLGIRSAHSAINRLYMMYQWRHRIWLMLECGDDMKLVWWSGGSASISAVNLPGIRMASYMREWCPANSIAHDWPNCFIVQKVTQKSIGRYFSAFVHCNGIFHDAVYARFERYRR